MKKALLSLLLAVFATASFAQNPISDEDVIVNRLDKQGDQRWKHEISTSVAAVSLSNDNGIVSLDTERPLQTPANHGATFSFTFTTNQSITFTPGQPGNSIKAHLVNHTDSTLKLVFRRWQTLPNDSWFTNVCFGDLCYIHFVDSLPWGSIEYYEFPGNSEAEFKLLINAPEDANDSMSAYIRIQAINTTDEDSVGFFLSAKAMPQSSVGTSNVKTTFKIQSVYPSPLVSGSSLKVKLTAPENAGYSYAIFDNLGREAAFGLSSHELMTGENTVEITSLDGLVTGSYLLRVKFNGGGTDAIPFQVIR